MTGRGAGGRRPLWTSITPRPGVSGAAVPTPSTDVPLATTNRGGAIVVPGPRSPSYRRAGQRWFPAVLALTRSERRQNHRAAKDVCSTRGPPTGPRLVTALTQRGSYTRRPWSSPCGRFTRAPGAPSRRWDRAPDLWPSPRPCLAPVPRPLSRPVLVPAEELLARKEGRGRLPLTAGAVLRPASRETDRRRPRPSSAAVVCRPSPSQHTLAPNLRLPPRKRPVPPPWHGSRNDYPGDVLLSQGAAPQVPSALVVLTSVFGMGTGVAPPLWSPGTLLYLS